MKKNWLFVLLLTFAALSLAGTAAYFSIFGLSKLFAGAGLGIIILASVLEFSKLVAVSYVYRFWEKISKALRYYYVAGVIFIMLLTSMGIYGFLTSAYQSTANKIEIRDSKIKIAQNKKDLFTAQLDRINKSIESDNIRIDKMANIRDQQENRVTDLYKNRSTTSARRTEGQISNTDSQMKALNDAITNKMIQTSAINDSISYYDQIILEYKTSDVSSEVGPLKYLADLTGFSMNKVVNILVLLIIFVFDPMAIALLIGVNQLTMKKEEELVLDEDVKDSQPTQKPDDELDIKIKELYNKLIADNEKQNIIKKIEEEFSINKIINEKKEIITPLTTDYDDEEEDNFNKIEKLVDIDKKDIKEKMVIYHNNFGKGVVVKSDIEKNRILIKFDNYGIKEINPVFAKLKQVIYIDKGDSGPEVGFLKYNMETSTIEPVYLSKEEENKEDVDENSLEDYKINDNDLNVKLINKDLPIRDKVDKAIIEENIEENSEDESIIEENLDINKDDIIEEEQSIVEPQEEEEQIKKKMNPSTRLLDILAHKPIGWFKKK